VIGHRQCVQSQALGLLCQFFGRRRAVEERIRRVRVQLGVRDRVGGPLDLGSDVGSALVRPRRAVTAVRADRAYDGVRVVMVTTETEQVQVARALAAGADEYVMKPFTRDILVAKLSLLGVFGE
jgi:DNA-binding NarL/FixJ family response regulator